MTRPVLPDGHISHFDLEAWYHSPLGRRLRDSESRALGEVLPTLFGYHLLQVGSSGHDWLSDSPIPHRMRLLSDVSPGLDKDVISGLPEALPFSQDSIDTLLLLHTLEFSADPHQVLREVERVLLPEGYLLILGFNPFSLWGLRRLFRLRRGKLPWHGHFHRLLKVKDWLRLLGFDIVGTRRLYFRPPIQHDGISRRLEFMERFCGRWCPLIGGAYLLVAKKKTSALTPIKPRWRPKRSVVSGLADTSTRTMHD